MIGYIKGKVLTADNGVVLLENNGIGYEITCSNAVYQKLLSDRLGEVYTYLAVKEDGLSLYGFNSIEEKNMFLKLITVSGVGPKMGINVLSELNLKSLALMITSADVKGLSKVKGLGKKTAERIILELREKIGVPDGESAQVVQVQKVSEVKVNQEALSVLIGFGFTQKECVPLLEKAQADGISAPNKLVEYVLKNI